MKAGREEDLKIMLDLNDDQIDRYFKLKPIYNVVDLFGGKGNMLMTCEKSNRKCNVMDIAPECCQIILDRWQSYTNLKANKLTGGIPCET